jgi:uncharacterized protein YbgA (DUF1722 family)/uncharacterized protein YbbK (DUF523 family)
MTKKSVIATDISPATDQGGSLNKSAINIGLSACLAGHEVRYNGGHTQSRLCLNTLSKHFNFTTFCPEVAAGFSTPRPAMRLIGDPENPTLTFSDNENEDLTEQLTQGFENKLTEFAQLDGYILMKNSPSCGLERIKVYQKNGYPHQTRISGVFARALKEQNPLMPIEEEGRLHDPRLFENFVLRVYAYHNFRKEVLIAPSLHKLIAFHSSYKYLLMAHNQTSYKKLGRLLGQPHNALSLEEIIHNYLHEFMNAISKPANAKNHTNALLHMVGYLKRSIPSQARQHIVAVIQNYHQGLLPLITPLTLLKHYLDQYGSSYIKSQRYLNPYPESIGLANKI